MNISVLLLSQISNSDSKFLNMVFSSSNSNSMSKLQQSGNTKGGSITVPLTSCLTDLESAVRQLTFFVFICKTDQQFLFLFAKQTNPNQSNRRSTVQWYFPLLVFPATMKKDWWVGFLAGATGFNDLIRLAVFGHLRLTKLDRFVIKSFFFVTYKTSYSVRPWQDFTR